MVSPDVVDIGSEYFVVHLSCVCCGGRRGSKQKNTIGRGVLYAACLVGSEMCIRDRSHAVEVLVLGLPVVVYKIPCSSCIFNTAVVVACVVFTHGFSRCRGYWV